METKSVEEALKLIELQNNLLKTFTESFTEVINKAVKDNAEETRKVFREELSSSLGEITLNCKLNQQGLVDLIDAKQQVRIIHFLAACVMAMLGGVVVVAAVVASFVKYEVYPPDSFWTAIGNSAGYVFGGGGIFGGLGILAYLKKHGIEIKFKNVEGQTK